MRAAAKNFPHVVVVPTRAYPDGALDDPKAAAFPTRCAGLAAEAFQHVSTYDALVAEYLRGPGAISRRLTVLADWQRSSLRREPSPGGAAYIRPTTSAPTGLLGAKQLRARNCPTTTSSTPTLQCDRSRT